MNDKSQICDYFHVTEHHPVTGYSCLMFPSAGRLRWTGRGGASIDLFLNVCFWSALFERIPPCSHMRCPLVQASKMNQEKKTPLPSVSIKLFYSGCRSLKETKSKSKKSCYCGLTLSPAKTGGVSTMLTAATVDLWAPRLICGAHYCRTSFICFNVHISLHTLHSSAEQRL